MNREIKFKAYHKEKNRIYCVETLEFGSLLDPGFGVFLTYVEKGPRSSFTQFFWEYDKTKIELLQFTGMKDKNGIEIYEGDIVEIMNDCGRIKTHVVEFNNGCYLPGRFAAGGELSHTMKVIGNIYKNPDLLKC